MGDFYVEYKPRTTDPPELTDQARREAESTWGCLDCGTPKPGTRAVDVQLEAAPHGPLSFVAGGCLALGTEDFLFRFGRERVERDLWLGKVFGPNGRALEGWVTFRGRHELHARGSEHVGHRRCPTCDRLFYFAMGRRYLCPRPPADAELFTGSIIRLIVPGSVAAACDMLKLRGVYVQRLPVLDEPLDELPVDLG